MSPNKVNALVIQCVPVIYTEQSTVNDGFVHQIFKVNTVDISDQVEYCPEGSLEELVIFKVNTVDISDQVDWLIRTNY